MPKPRRFLEATADLTLTPPDELSESQSIARIATIEGKSVYSVALPSTDTLLVELAPRFRNKIWLKKGGYVLIDKERLKERSNKLDGEIVNIVRDEKAWRKAPWWPKEFPKQTLLDEDSDEEEEESNVGKMPPSDSEAEQE